MPVLAKCGNFSGQFWDVAPSTVSGYSVLRTLFTGMDKCLDRAADGKENKLAMSACANSPGQSWTMEPARDPNHVRLRTQLVGQNQCLSIIQIGKTNRLVMVECDDSLGQLWNIERATPVSGIYKKNFDPDVRIQDDLYLAVNGNWIKATPSTYRDALSEGDDKVQERIHAIIEQAGKLDHPDETRIVDLYASYMDEARIDQLGITPLKPMLDEIDRIVSKVDLTRALGHFQATSGGMPLQINFSIDAHDSGRYQLILEQNGVDLGRDDYIKNETASRTVRVADTTYLATLFQLIDFKPSVARRKAAAIMLFQAKLARAQRDNVSLRDLEKQYNKFDRAGLKRAFPDLDWDVFLAASGVGMPDEISVSEPEYVRAVGKLLSHEPLSVWRDYLRARVLTQFAALLPKPFEKAQLELARATEGPQDMKPRWKNGTDLVNNWLGNSIGKRYVEENFTSESKRRVEVIVRNLLTAYSQSIDDLVWMNSATKAAAQEKLAALTVKIGYPDKWVDDSAIEIKADDLIGNRLRATKFYWDRELFRLQGKVDRSEWSYLPQQTAAGYILNFNSIEVPAAMLQPPFFNPDADEAVNYGAIGAVIGHEISHAFDDVGSHYDAKGNRRDWWQPDDRKAFDALTAQLGTQFSAYAPIPGHFVNAQLTMGENIADLSGLQISYRAYHLSLEGKEGAVMDGYTGDQRFFIGFAQIWRRKISTELQRSFLQFDNHSPSQFRTNGAAINSDDFPRAFDVRPGDGMFKPAAARIHIW